jgi:hypothetical protein
LCSPIHGSSTHILVVLSLTSFPRRDLQNAVLYPANIQVLGKEVLFACKINDLFVWLTCHWYTADADVLSSPDVCSLGSGPWESCAANC